jgi:ribonucrease Y
MSETLDLVHLATNFTIGLGTAIAAFWAWRYARLQEVKNQARRIVTEAAQSAQETEREAAARYEEFAEDLKIQNEEAIEQIEQNAEKISAKILFREEKFNDRFQDKEKLANEQASMVDQFEHKFKSAEGQYRKLEELRDRQWVAWIQKIESQFGVLRDDVVTTLKDKIITEFKLEQTRWTQERETEIHAEAEREARRLLALVLNRFVRPYCPERGIGYLNFSTPEQKDRVLGPEQINLRTVEKLCGVDLVYDDQNNSVNVYGFDPVRRELGRATVERMMEEKGRFDEGRISGLVDSLKKTLFRRMMQDGEKIAKELRAENLHPEIKNMMGALRYRYSFTQNQYFHCAEVGFLCGLLASELNVNLHDARRAGLLHDIGKAMDHTQEGGHAVIGADFIEKNSEAHHIVHAVRAHHFDVQPDADLDYLVIAADAISGARPGARRSTAQTYTQKIQDLQSIAFQFAGVTDTHIVSSGREVRIYVDGAKVDDHGALKISQGIVEKIENELAYPGQIKVTVVRSTQAVEYAR